MKFETDCGKMLAQWIVLCPECQRDKMLNSHELLSLAWLHTAWQMAERRLMFLSNLSVGWNQSQVIISPVFPLISEAALKLMTPFLNSEMS